MQGKRLFILVNVDKFLLSHRKEIVQTAVERGYDVTVVCKDTGLSKQICDLGASFVDLPVNPTGTNIIQELKTLIFLIKLFKKEKPDIVHNVGLKSILWGGLAAKLTNVYSIVNAVSGLGVMFSTEKVSLYTQAIICALRFANKRKRISVIFQNDDDKQLFLNYKIVKEPQCAFIKGSGVDLSIYKYTLEIPDEKLHIIFTARMVKEKGVVTLIEAANMLRPKYQDKVEFWLCGGLSDNPLALSKTELQEMCDGKYIQWLGHRSDILQLLQRSHIVAFPSYYREGVPKSLIEACAIGRPIITTDSVGCRDTVIDGYNGFLVPIKNSDILAQKIEILINDRALRESMGLQSRHLAEQEFSIINVVDRHFQIYKELLQ